MVVSPAVLFIFVMASSISSGRSVLMLLTRAFLFVVSNPDLGLRFSIQAVMKGFGVWVFGAQMVLLR